MKSTEEIQGWFGFQSVYNFLVSSVPDGGTFVECGAWLGKSSSYLCDIAKDRINVHIVDTWKGTPNELNGPHALALTHDIYSMFLSNMGDRKFNAIRKDSVEASKQFEDNSCDVVFIDMDHTFDAVMRDIQAWTKKVKIGGYIAGHDYTPAYKHSVVRAVRSSFDLPSISQKLDCWVVKKE
jgi:hypothetical protein